ncbi:ejaculatory bulb-specific protein 3-like [Nasonia vitripennis]|uniref:Uncharacterized protein n=1 Tax=Nasonia vitripennis TaxID=7425 RepID=A0A7M7G1K6_NASVI|nr:ejaculatory bulb-specific protein 3-like [Nasonia vitripennis]
MDKRMCWLALCWLLGCRDNKRDTKIHAGGVNSLTGSVTDLTNSHGYPWPQPNTYITRWDKVNLDEILDSKRLLQHYFNCLMSKGPCPPDGLELKRNLPEALANACAKCSKSQIEGAVKVIRYLREFEPVKFEILANKYDPQGIYRKMYFEASPEETNNSLNNDQQSIDNRRRRRRRRKRLAR